LPFLPLAPRTALPSIAMTRRPARPWCAARCPGPGRGYRGWSGRTTSTPRSPPRSRRPAA